ncbi:MAG: hypothetical protein H6888_13985 [Nitratireductor sp.]|nr:hypothetical protein [Nitratireductor sp.]
MSNGSAIVDQVETPLVQPSNQAFVSIPEAQEEPQVRKKPCAGQAKHCGIRRADGRNRAWPQIALAGRRCAAATSSISRADSSTAMRVRPSFPCGRLCNMTLRLVLFDQADAGNRSSIPFNPRAQGRWVTKHISAAREKFVCGQVLQEAQLAVRKKYI